MLGQSAIDVISASIKMRREQRTPFEALTLPARQPQGSRFRNRDACGVGGVDALFNVNLSLGEPVGRSALCRELPLVAFAVVKVVGEPSGLYFALAVSQVRLRIDPAIAVVPHDGG
jgi:hypothetical protein